MTVQDSQAQDKPLTKGAAVVRDLLRRHGIERRQWTVKVAEILELGRSAAHNRIYGDTSWVWDDVEKLGAYFGETVHDMARPEPVQRALLILDNKRASVTVQIGQGQPGRGDIWAAYVAPQGLTVVPANKISGLGVQPLKVLELIHPQHELAEQMRVAVLDDASDTAHSIAYLLEQRGQRPHVYTKADDLIADLPRVVFNAFIVDWLLGQETAERSLAAIRAQAPQARIVLLTGEIGGSATTGEVAEAQLKYQFVLVQKPVNADLLMSNLSLDVEVHGAAS